MPRYYRPSSKKPLMDAGLVEFAADDGVTRRMVEKTVGELARDQQRSPIAAQYEAPRQLLLLLGKLQRELNAEDAKSVKCRISFFPDDDRKEKDDQTDHACSESADGWFPLSELFGEVGGRSISDYILYRIYTTYLQPIVQINGNPVGYEFLLRPLPEQSPFRPAKLFEEARNIGHHAFLDRSARHSAIRMGASHLQPGIKRFINFLPSSLHRPATCLRDTFDLMNETGTTPEDCVFEVVESEPLDDPGLAHVFDVYRQQKIRLALDDVGSGFSTLNTVDRLKPDYVKMDRRWVSGCDSDPDKQRYIEGLMERVSRFNGVVLAEGVERQEEWDYLRRAGVQLFQGYLFGRAMPVPALTSVGSQ